MDRALTSGVGAGTTLALALRLLDIDKGVVKLAPPAPCPWIEAPEPHLHYWSFLLGLLAGFILWPILELLLHLRWVS